MKRNIIVALIIVILAALGYKLWNMIEGPKKKQQRPPIVVDAVSVKQQQWYDQIQATGTLQAFQGVMIRPEVSGRVTKIYFSSGQAVEQGAPLLQIYPDILEAQLVAAKASTALAEIEFKRAQELYEKKAASKQDLDKASSALVQNQAAIGETKAELIQHNLTAPFTGTLGLKLVDVGDFLSVGEDIVNLQQQDPLRIEFSIPEVYLSKLAIGQEVEVIPSSDSQNTYSGEVYAFDSAINVQTRSLFMRAKVPNQDKKLIPGTFAKVTLLAGKKHDVLTVPQTALVYSPAGLSVYIIKNNVANKTNVVIGERRNNEIEITSGLAKDDIVVSAGQVKLTDKDPVKMATLDGVPQIKPGDTDSTAKSKQTPTQPQSK